MPDPYVDCLSSQASSLFEELSDNPDLADSCKIEDCPLLAYKTDDDTFTTVGKCLLVKTIGNIVSTTLDNRGDV